MMKKHVQTMSNLVRCYKNYVVCSRSH